MKRCVLYPGRFKSKVTSFTSLRIQKYKGRGPNREPKSILLSRIDSVSSLIRNLGRDLRISEATLRSLQPNLSKVSLNVRSRSNTRADIVFGVAIRVVICVCVEPEYEI